MTFPILEHDPDRQAMIEPRWAASQDFPEHCVLCFFGEVVEKIAQTQKVRKLSDNRWEDGPHPIYELDHHGQKAAFFQPGIGGPLSAGLLEDVIGRGATKFIACGGCGVLEKDILLGNLLIVTSAVRDEGLSYHYLPPSREVAANPVGVRALQQTLESRCIPHRLVKTWTTDAPYRETRGKVESRRAEGCSVVEMEAASLAAAAQFRDVILGQVLYGGDDLSGAAWDNRGWQSLADVRENLFWLSVEACLSL